MFNHLLRQISATVFRFTLLAALALGMFSIGHAQSVATGKSYYTTAFSPNSGSANGSACTSCHISDAASGTFPSASSPSAGHLSGSNDYARILTAMNAGGLMAGYFNPIRSSAEAFSLSLFIGQYKAPAFTVANGNAQLAMTVRSGAAATKDIYPLLASDGSGGAASDTGFTKTNGSNGSVVATQVGATTAMNYNASYTSTAGFTGSDSFTVTVSNPTGSANRTVAVTVVGIDSAGTVTGYAGQTYTSGSPLYQISSSNGTLTSFNASGLPSGLSVNASGQVVGTSTATGTFTVTLGATTSGTVNDGAVSKTLTLTMAGATSSATLNLTQNATTSLPFSFTTFPTATASSFSITSGSLPPGVAFSTSSGVFSASPSPTTAGTYPLTVQATAGAAGVVAQSLNIVVASAGVPAVSTSPTLSASPTPNIVGTVNTAISNITVSGTNPPLNSNSFTQSGLPPGLGINAGTGVISGTPTTSGDYSVSLGVSNASGAGTLTVVMRINAIAAPTISSASTASGTVGSSATQYTVTTDGTNGPIKATGGYSVFSGSLPAGLGLNADTGVVSGTPSASGVSTVTLAAENTGNVKGTKAVTFTITPNAVPVITSPTSGSTTALSLGIAMSSVTIVATNPPLTGFAITSGALPTGVSLNTGTGVISGTPSTTSASTPVGIKATNAAGDSSPITLNFSVGAPAPGNCTISTSANTAVTVDLKPCMFPSLNPSGVSVSMAPGFGTVTVGGTSVTYTPKPNFFGTDTFQAVAYFGNATPSAASTVTVTVTGRPDPTQDATVTGSLAAQAETALRFARTQSGNYSRYLENMRARRGVSRRSSTPTASFSQAQEHPPALTISDRLASIGTNDVTRLPQGSAQASLPVSSGIAMAASGLGLANDPIYSIATNLVQNRQVDLGRASAALDSALPAGALPGPKVWVEGVVSFGVRDASGTVSAADYNSSGITVGTDLSLNDKLTVGMGIGYAKDTTNIGTDGTRTNSRGTSMAVYGSYQPEGKGFVEGVIGLGTIDYDMQRYVSAVNDFALSNRKGLQLFGSVGGGYEFRDKGRMISPYGRIDFSTDRLDETTETGAGAYALNYSTQTNSALQGVAGLRGEAIHATSFGWAIPRARIEIRQDLMDKSEASISYADQIGGTRYSISPSGTLRSALVFGIGSEFLFRNGWAFGADYQLTQVSATESSYALRLKLTKELGAKGLPNLLAGVEFEPSSDEGEWQVDAGTTFDDNITRAKAGSDVRADTIFNVNLSRSATVLRGGNTRLVLTGTAGGERFQTTNGLSNMLLTGEAAYQYRESSDFDTPTYGVFGRITALKHQSTLRDGARYAYGLTAMQPLTDRLTGFAALTFNTRTANNTVFNTADTSLRANLDFALHNGGTLYLTGEYRDGDIVSTGKSSLENITIAKVLVLDDAYTGGQFFSYRFGATTLLTTIGYNVGLGARDSIDIAWRRVESTPSVRPTWATSPNSYISNQISASYLMRF